MATFIPTPNGMEVTLQAHNGGDKLVNVFGVYVGTGAVVDKLEDVGTVFVEWATNIYKQLLNTAVVLDFIRAKDISVVDGVVNEQSLLNGIGTNTGEHLPNNLCALVRYGTAQGGRSGRGHTFVLPTVEEDLTNAIWTPAYVAGVTDAWLSLRDALVLKGVSLAVWSRTKHAVYPITSHSVNQEIAVQRDRLPGKRAHRRRRIAPTP